MVNGEANQIIHKLGLPAFFEHGRETEVRNTHTTRSFYVFIPAPDRC